MIIKLLLNLIIKIISLVPFNIPNFPASVSTYLDTFKGYLQDGIGFIKFFLPWDYVILLLKIILSIVLALEIYKFVMWVVRKIPMLNVKD